MISQYLFLLNSKLYIFSLIIW